jgi:hypothetical protein
MDMSFIKHKKHLRKVNQYSYQQHLKTNQYKHETNLKLTEIQTSTAMKTTF